MNWTDPITGKAGAVRMDIEFPDKFTIHSTFYAQPYDLELSCGEYVSKMLDSRVTIFDSSIGRVLFRGSLMALALWRLEGAGLKQVDALPRFETPEGHHPLPSNDNPAVCSDCGFHCDEHEQFNKGKS